MKNAVIWGENEEVFYILIWKNLQINNFLKEQVNPASHYYIFTLKIKM